jgi:hypothetical protein
METINDILEKRKKDLLEWIEEESPSCSKEQRHLDAGTPERAYWHYGYAIALKDVLALLGDTSTPKH